MTTRRAVGKAPFAVDEAPRPHEGSDGDVERSLGCAGEGLTSLEQGEEPWLDFDRHLAGSRVDPRDIARRTIRAQLPVEPRDLGERFFAGAAQPHRVARPEHQLE